jgi:hypothetical protein
LVIVFSILMAMSRKISRSKNDWFSRHRPVVKGSKVQSSEVKTGLWIGIFSIDYIRLASFHPEMALFPLSVVLRGFPPATYLSVRLGENPCAA